MINVNYIDMQCLDIVLSMFYILSNIYFTKGLKKRNKTNSCLTSPRSFRHYCQMTRLCGFYF